MTDSVDHHFDACGLMCPEPVMMLHSKVRGMNAGEVLEVRVVHPALAHPLVRQAVDVLQE